MAQCVKALVAKTSDLSLISGDGKRRELSLLPKHSGTLMHVCTLMKSNKSIDIFKW